jgi:hypothetical protein
VELLVGLQYELTRGSFLNPMGNQVMRSDSIPSPRERGSYPGVAIPNQLNKRADDALHARLRR